MERREPRAFGRNASTEEQVSDAGLHFFGGFVCEGDCEDVFGGDAVRNEISHAESDGAGFAGAGTGENEHGTFGGFRGETLFRVELI